MIDWSKMIRRDVQFKCRRCSQVFDEERILERLDLKLKNVPESIPSDALIKIAPIQHACKDGGVGVADVIGSNGPNKPLGNPYD